VYLIVVFDLAKIQSLAAALGISFSMLSDPDWAYQFEKSVSGAGEPIVGRMSRHFADRMACELLSWDWVLGMEQFRLTQDENELRKEV
jgi:hypothetical protein